METDILIIGGGLSGLVSALRLHQNRRKVLIVEARDRLGGRIHTVSYDQGPTMEMGATWLGAKHTVLNDLLIEMDIKVFPQLIGDKAIYEAISTSPPYLATLPPNPEPSLRIRKGSYTLIEALASQLPAENILLDHPIEAIEQIGDKLIASGPKGSVQADKIISTLPPHLFVNTIKCKPDLPTSFMELCDNTHTWMGESIKIALSYAAPFWKEKNTSGTMFSNVGPVPELYDHSNSIEDTYALMGFLNGNYFGLTKDERLQLILRQLTKYYGDIVSDYLHYEETVWKNEPYTHTPYKEHILPHQNNGHAVFGMAYLDGQLIISGTETSPTFPGYMEGAIISGYRASDLCLGQNESV